jgi:hypothetical protein
MFLHARKIVDVLREENSRPNHSEVVGESQIERRVKMFVEESL